MAENNEGGSPIPAASEARLQNLINSSRLGIAQRVRGAIQNEIQDYVTRVGKFSVSDSVAAELARRAALVIVARPARNRAAEYRNVVTKLEQLYQEASARISGGPNREPARLRGSNRVVDIRVFRRLMENSAVKIAPFCL